MRHLSNTRSAILVRMAYTILGLAIFAFGEYLSIQTGIGVAPWDVFSLGLASKLGLSYGVCHTSISVLILIVDLLLHERIGYGTVFDAFLVGNIANLFMELNIVQPPKSFISSVLLLICGLFIMAFGLYFYMREGMCCGPRDSLLVGVGKRLPKVPIGAVDIMILCVVLIFGWILDGPIGIGTLICAGGAGIAMQIVFRLLHFEPRDVRHQDIKEITEAFIKNNEDVSR